ncbi:hypothetical protein PRZ01_13365 [Paucibacter sp. hw1]|uniref:Transposase n=1 Tax=Roseateles koreensis TaxID=2987526 RepID=A0ABT5KTC0_9BURK|nr:hypothetical protein [Roseateles koreensis]MDC8786183.1 hypothetical protein [Roseateles koreensis]
MRQRRIVPQAPKSGAQQFARPCDNLKPEQIVAAGAQIPDTAVQRVANDAGFACRTRDIEHQAGLPPKQKIRQLPLGDPRLNDRDGMIQ